MSSVLVVEPLYFATMTLNTTRDHERPDSKRRPVSVLALGDCLGHGNLESQSLYAAS